MAESFFRQSPWEVPRIHLLETVWKVPTGTKPRLRRPLYRGARRPYFRVVQASHLSSLMPLQPTFQTVSLETVRKIVRAASRPYFLLTGGGKKRASLPFLSTHGGATTDAIRNFQTVSLRRGVNSVRCSQGNQEKDQSRCLP